MTDIELAALVTIIVAVCEAVKQAGVPSRWMPLLALVLGLGGTFYFTDGNFLMAGAGAIIGLGATGGYRLVKTTILNK